MTSDRSTWRSLRVVFSLIPQSASDALARMRCQLGGVGFVIARAQLAVESPASRPVVDVVPLASDRELLAQPPRPPASARQVLVDIRVGDALALRDLAVGVAGGEQGEVAPLALGQRREQLGGLAAVKSSSVAGVGTRSS
jgi:hypothetical protein